MKKYIILGVITSSLILLASCTLPGQSSNQNQRGNYSGMRGGEDISDIVRLKNRKGGPRGEMMGSGRIERFGSGSRMSSGERFGSGAFMDRFSSLTQADKDLLRQSMEARRSGDSSKAEKIMNTLKTKYPDVFSGSMIPEVKPDRGGELPAVQ